MISRPVFYTKPFLFKSMLLVFIFIVVPACGGGGGSDSSKDDFKSGNKDSTSSKTANSLSRDVYLQMPSTDGITLRWQTKSAAKSEVVYSANLENLDEMKSTSKVATAISTKASSIQRALTDEQRTKHEVSLSGLEAEKRYYYVVRDGSKNLTSPSEDRYFMTLPVSLNTQSTRAWVLGNTGIDVQSTLALLNGYTTYSGDLPTDFVLLLGNNVPQIKPDDYDTSLFGPLKSVFYNTAIWPTLGVFEQKGMAPNTSIDDPDAPYFSAFKLPKRGEMGGAMSNTEAYYSFDHGETHFVALNTLGLTSSNRLVLHVSSDVGRTPHYNGNAGKDHWKNGSAMLVMKNKNWTNRVVGVSGARHEKVNIDTAILQERADGVRLTTDYVHQTLRKILNIDNDPLAQRFKLVASPIDTLNPSRSSPVSA